MADTGRCGSPGNDISYLKDCAGVAQSQIDMELKVYDQSNNIPDITCDSNIKVLACEKALQYIW